jgi:hypothetical protein
MTEIPNHNRPSREKSKLEIRRAGERVSSSRRQLKYTPAHRFATLQAVSEVRNFYKIRVDPWAGGPAFRDPRNRLHFTLSYNSRIFTWG